MLIVAPAACASCTVLTNESRVLGGPLSWNGLKNTRTNCGSRAFSFCPRSARLSSDSFGIGFVLPLSVRNPEA